MSNSLANLVDLRRGKITPFIRVNTLPGVNECVSDPIHDIGW